MLLVSHGGNSAKVSSYNTLRVSTVAALVLGIALANMGQDESRLGGWTRQSKCHGHSTVNGSHALYERAGRAKG